MRSFFLKVEKLLVRIFSKIPLFGGVIEAKSKSRLSACSELAISTIFSTSPIWFFPILASTFIGNSPGFFDNFLSSVNQGDLFIYSSALVGPLIFAITKNYAAWGSENPSPNASRFGKLTFEFPSGKWFFLIAVAICAIAAICFGLLRFSNMGLITVNIRSDNMLIASGWLYVFSLICLYAVSVYKNELEDFSNEPGEDTKDFVNQWNSRND